MVVAKDLVLVAAMEVVVEVVVIVVMVARERVPAHVVTNVLIYVNIDSQFRQI